MCTGRALIVLGLLLCSSIALSQPTLAQGDEIAFDLHENTPPQVTWSKNLDAGYISTSPLVWGGLVVVKSPSGLHAFMQSDGSEVWNVSMTSVTNFEMAPLLKSPSISQGEQILTPDLIITGWSSGEVTAHRLADGALHWAVSTQAPGYGIHGGLILRPDLAGGHEILVATELGATSLDPVDGGKNWEVTFPDGVRGYRHWPAYWLQDGEVWYATGDEEGRLTYWNASQPEQATTLSLGIEDGKMRSKITGDNAGRLFIPIQSPSGSALFDWTVSASTSIQFSGNFGLLDYSEGRMVVPTTDNTTLWDCSIDCIFLAELSAEPTIGEAKWVDESTIAIPINKLVGELVIYHISMDNVGEGGEEGENISTLLWNWKPQVEDYMTAGIGVSENLNVISISNDASFIETSVNSGLQANNSYQYTKDSLTDWLAQRGSDPPSPKYESKPSDLNSAPILVGFGLSIGIFAGLLHLSGKRQQYSFAFAATLMLIGMLMLLPAIQLTFNEAFTDDGKNRDDSLWPEHWEGTQVIGFQFTDPYLPAPYTGMNTQLDQDGTIISSVPAAGETPTLWVGGLYGASTPYELTMMGAGVAGLEVEYHDETIGGYVDSIAFAEDGVEDRWLLYWVDGEHANLAVNAYSIDKDATVIWQYL